MFSLPEHPGALLGSSSKTAENIHKNTSCMCVYLLGGVYIYIYMYRVSSSYLVIFLVISGILLEKVVCSKALLSTKK
jgi:hypothetical protein